ncbi:uncharacterized protein LOC110344414 [Heterocephalus glaber]|uniref:Uncharacterized protein LOC110344414 n=1 Tax=Heterocephalus glaber TaxID=10181 RepID=A0AAX6RB29_HETGA|nr:uncharacterized protein LOC110344414 [Heterocephalus glaber]
MGPLTAQAQRSRFLLLAPERFLPALSRSLDPRAAVQSLPHSLSRPSDSAAAPPLQLRLSQELPQRPDVTAPPPPQTRQEEGGERRRGCGACAGAAGPLSRRLRPGERAIAASATWRYGVAGGRACARGPAFHVPRAAITLEEPLFSSTLLCPLTNSGPTHLTAPLLPHCMLRSLRFPGGQRGPVGAPASRPRIVGDHLLEARSHGGELFCRIGGEKGGGIPHFK